MHTLCPLEWFPFPLPRWMPLARRWRAVPCSVSGQDQPRFLRWPSQEEGLFLPRPAPRVRLRGRIQPARRRCGIGRFDYWQGYERCLINAPLMPVWLSEQAVARSLVSVAQPKKPNCQRCKSNFLWWGFSNRRGEIKSSIWQAGASYSR